MIPILSIGAASASGGKLAILGAGARHLEAVPLDQQLRQRPAEQARDDQPHRCDRDPALQRRRKAVLLGDRRPPGDRRAMPADQRHRPTITPAALGMPSATAPMVPTRSCRNTKATVTRQRTPRTRPPAARSASRAFTPTVAKKMTSSLSRVVMSKSMSTPRTACTAQRRQGGDEATGDRFRDAVAAQERHPLGDEHADKKDDDPDREGKEVRCDEARNIGHDGSMIVMVRVKPIVAGSSASYAPRGGDRKHGQSNRCGVPVLSTFGALAAEVPAEPGGKTPI